MLVVLLVIDMDGHYVCWAVYGWPEHPFIWRAASRKAVEAGGARGRAVLVPTHDPENPVRQAE